jgi:hypothetical protein
MSGPAAAPTAGVAGTPRAVRESDKLPPSGQAGLITVFLVGVSLLLAWIGDLGKEFTPRVETLDALAGLSIGAFLVDRMLTFVPPLGATRTPPLQRAADLKILRLGYGALLGMIFVSLTDLRAVHVLTPDTSKEIGAGLDRAIAVLAIAGGVAGLARIMSGINPQPNTDATMDPNTAVPADADTAPPPSMEARIFGIVAVGLAAALALIAIGDKNGVDLVGPDKNADGTVALVVRFGLVFLAAAVVEQIAEVIGRTFAFPKNNRPLLLGGLSVVLGVAAARLLDLYLLHNIGFFGATPDFFAAQPGRTLSDALAASSGLDRWADTFFTGLVIAAGTKPLHDLSSRLRKAKKT